MSCTQFDSCPGMTCCKPSKWLPISSTNTGMVSARPIQKRRCMSMSSGFGPWSALTSSGSKAMPQIGHDPGPIWRICGCMGHV